MANLDFKNQQQIIDYATLATQIVKQDNKIEDVESKVLQRTISKEISNAIIAREERGLKTNGIICTFHAILNENERNLNIKDVEYNQHRSDYEEVIGLHYKKARQTNRDYIWVLITDRHFKPDIDNLDDEVTKGNICLIRNDINTEHLMFERAVLNYNLCKALGMNMNIVYLDGDAFIMESIEKIWNIDSNIILTYREQTEAGTIVPINEGVIFCKKGKESLRFFEDYLITYLILSEDKNLGAYYKKTIKRWRGGQLSLNAVRNNSFLIKEKKYSISELPCHKFNCFPKIYSPINAKTKFVIHIKGKDKSFDLIKQTL